MPSYEVVVIRTTTETASFTVKATDAAEAEAKVSAIVDPPFQDMPNGEWEKIEKKAKRAFSNHLVEDADQTTDFEYEVDEDSE